MNDIIANGARRGRDDLFDLLEQYCAETMEPVGLASLRSRLLADAGARALYMEYMDLNARLRWRASAREIEIPGLPLGSLAIGETRQAFRGKDEIKDEVPSANASASSARAPDESGSAANPAAMGRTFWHCEFIERPRAMSLFAALLAVVVMLGIMAYFRAPGDKKTSPSNAPIAEASGEVVARLANSQAARWKNGGELRSGERLRAGHHLELESGLAEVYFASGASVLLEGPAHFVVKAPNEGRLQKGRLTALVNKKAFGFTVATPHVKVTDLGTEFGVAAHDAETFVRVYAGEVELVALDENGSEIEGRSPEERPRRLRANEAANVGGGEIAPSASESEEFVRRLPTSAPRFAFGEKHRETVMQAKPLAYWSFDAFDGGAVENRVADAPALQAYGAVAGEKTEAGGVARFLADRQNNRYGFLYATEGWGALKNSAYSVEVWVRAVPGAHHQTLVAWGDSSRGGIQTANSHANHSMRHCFLLELIGANHDKYAEGSIRLMHHGDPTNGNTSTEYAVPGAFISDAWNHLAAVNDGKKLALYINGKKRASLDVKGGWENAPTDFVAGALTHDEDTTPATFPYRRYLSGDLAELAIYGRALSSAEVYQRYRGAMFDEKDEESHP